MKHVVLSLAAAFAVISSGLAQCTADFDFGDGVTFGISPDVAAGETFADGYYLEPYEDVLHVLVPVSADELVGFPLALDSIVVEDISLLGEQGEAYLISDVGLTLTPNNNGVSANPYTFIGGGQYCADLTGTPDTTGFFVASVQVLAWSALIPGVPQSAPFAFEGFTLNLILEGCTDPMACNYDSLATVDDGSCAEFDALDVCGGDCFAADSTGCIELIMLGCMDSLACNYDMDANTDDGSCLVIGDACDDMDDMTVNDIVTDDCACVGEAIVEGCTDSSACNYVMGANVDDGSCLVIGDACDDNDEDTINDMITEDCECAGEVDAVLEVDFELKVYPNPTMGEVIILLPVGHAFDLNLVSLSGQTVHASQTTQGGPVVWNVEGLPAGAYLLHVRNAHATAVRRVLVGGR